jgi:acyl-CoA thioester hydrolase
MPPVTSSQQPATRFENGWHIVPWQVIFRDLDAFGHVNNATFFTFFEWGRAQLWFALTGGGLPRDIGFIVARAECDFKQQLGLEPIEIRTRIAEMGRTSLVFESEIRRENGLQLAAAGRVVVVLYDWERQSKVPIADDLRHKVEELQRACSPGVS